MNFRLIFRDVAEDSVRTEQVAVAVMLQTYIWEMHGSNPARIPAIPAEVFLSPSKKML
jgi:hypothetical protein